uniref:Extended synaptotagmin-like protein 1b n=1 Tax=Denticeps clupeoides TaxID=299321 RepID=A0AAY4ESR5_9TELE
MQKGDEKKEDSEKPEPPAAAHPARAEAPAAPGISAAGVLWTFGRCLSALLPVYLAGYYRLSTGLLAVGLVLYSGWRHTRDAKEARLRSAERLQSDAASGGTLRGRRDLPAWVSFPDVEKVEWLNKVLHQAWPFIGQYLKKLLMETIAPTIRSSSTHLQTLNFTKIDFGEKPMKVVGVKAHTENDRGQVLLDVYISYVGDVEIDVEVTRYFCKAGVKGIQLHGMMRVILEPLIEDVPIVGAVTMFFIRRPKLDINWTGLTNLLDIPGLNVMSDTMIMDIIASFLVLPNRLTVPLVPNLPVAQLRSPLPRGVVRIHLLEADRLAAKDNYVKGVMAGLSDPYAVVRVGPQSFTSRHQDDTLNPKWGEVYEVIVHEVPGQELEVEVYDKDPDQDDFLGRTKLDLGIVKKSLIVDEWIPLKDTETGRVRLKLEWLSLLSNTDKLDQVVQRNTTVASKTSDPASSAILAVYLDRAEAIPMKKGKEPSPMVQLSVQDITKESKTCWNTVTPQWEDAFTFFIQNPCKQDLDIQVKDHDHVLNLGSLSIPLVRLLSRPELTLDQWFQLEDSGSASRIYIKAVLRGVLRIHLVGGQNLVPKDNLMGGIVKGKSDPYVKISVGGKTFKSHTIKENLNPVWNELYEVPGQDVNLEVLRYNTRLSFLNKAVPSSALMFVYVERAHDLPVCERSSSPQWDESFYFLIPDPREEMLIVKLSSGDQPLGSLVLPIKEVLAEPELVLDQWVSLDGAPASQILLRAELKGDRVVTAAPELRPQQTTPDPSFATEGVLRIHILAAQNLIAKDNLMGGMVKGKSDPYVKVHIGDKTLKTHVIKENLNPVWNEMYELVLPQSWLILNEVKNGRLHVILEWLSKVSEPEKLNKALQLQSLQSYQNKAVPAAALLFVLLERAHSLPVSQLISHSITPTHVCDRSTSPQWNEVFYFLLHDPKEDMLIIKLSSAWEQPLGNLVLPVRELLSKPKLVLDQWLNLDGASAESQILLRAELKVSCEHTHTLNKVLILCFLNGHLPQKLQHEKPTPAPSAPADAKVTSSTDVQAQQTTPKPGFGTEGVLRIHILGAQNLVAMDNLMGGMVKGKSDPYVKVHVGDKTFKSHVIKENLNPIWNEMYELVLNANPDLEVKFELFDKDLDSDDFLGRIKLILSDIVNSQYSDKVLQLQSLQSYQNKAVPSAALLFVLLERAHSLPVCDRGCSPRWDEHFYFLVHDPKQDIQRSAIKAKDGPGSVAPPGWDFIQESDSTEGRTQVSALSLWFYVCVCRGLVTSSKDGLDTYVSLILLPDKSKATKKKTGVKKKDLNPEYNERFEIDLSLDEVQRRSLSVCVKNNSASFMSRDVVGQVSLSLQLCSSVIAW